MPSGIGWGKAREEATDFADFTDGKQILKSGKGLGKNIGY
jgi:hypothetical protein